MDSKRTTMLDVIAHEKPELLSSATLKADVATMIRIAESYNQRTETAAKAACRAVFQTSELLENILVHVPARTLFAAQRVSKSFKSTIAKSREIQEKLCLKKRDDPGTKILMNGYIQTAAVPNPLFAPYCSTTIVHGQKVELTFAERALRDNSNSDDRRHGVIINHPVLATKDSSFMKTFLFDKACTINVVYLEVRMGEHGPSVFFGCNKVNMQEGWTIGDIYEEVLSKNCDVVVMSKKAAEAHRLEYAWRYSWWTSQEHVSRHAGIPWGHVGSLKVQLNCGREAWKIQINATPRAVIQTLERLCGCLPEVYFCPSQGPTFWPRDVVIPSPRDWVDIEAKKNRVSALTQKSER